MAAAAQRLVQPKDGLEVGLTHLSHKGQRWQSGGGDHRAEKGDGWEKPQNGSEGEENLN